MTNENLNEQRSNKFEKFRKRSKNVKTYPPELSGLSLVPSYKSSGKRGETLLFGIDVGSTNTRVTFISETYYPSLENEDAYLDYVIIPTRMVVDENINPKSSTFIYKDPANLSKELYENMDSIIDPIQTSEDSLDKCFTKGMRVVRGGKSVLYNFKQENILTLHDKTKSESYMATVIDSIAYAIIYKYSQEKKDMPVEFSVKVGLSVRPEEVSSDAIRRLRDALCYEYNWTSLAYGCRFKIKIEDIYLQSEPESLVKQFYNDLETPKFVCNIMGGGSNSGTCILKDGISSPTGVKKLTMCGSVFETRLQESVNMLREKQGETRLNLTPYEMDRLINQGVIKISNVDVDYKDLVTSLKKVAGKEIAQELLSKVFTDGDFQLSTMDAILFSGNFFKRSNYLAYQNCDNPVELLDKLKEELSRRRPTEQDKEQAKMLLDRIANERPSIADAIIDEFTKIAPGIIKVIVEENLIPLGNLNNVIDNNEDDFFDILEKLSVIYPELLEDDEEDSEE